MRIVLQTSRENQLYAKASKCEFWMEEVRFLDHVVSDKEILVDPTKVETVTEWKQPKNTLRFVVS